MTARLMSLIALFSMACAAPAQAQQSGLNDSQVEFFAEFLTMGEVCREFDNFTVREEELHNWMARRLSTESEEDLEAVLSLRDSKIADLQNAAEQLRDMPRNNRRENALNEHYARSFGRCGAMADHPIAGNYILRR